MDPFSICANVVTVLQAANAVISLCYDFRAALKDAPWSLTQVLDEILTLRDILQRLERAAYELDASPDPLEQQRKTSLELLCGPDRGPLACCRRELVHLQSTLSTPNFLGECGTKRFAFLQVLGWRLKDHEAKESLARIERCKTTLNLALCADETALLADIKKSTASVDWSVQHIGKSVTSILVGMHSKELDEKRRSILQWLSPVNPAESHEAASESCQAGTGNWFLQSPEFSMWSSASKSSMWLSGFPGSGKTVLMSSIVSHLTQSTSDSSQNFVAYFYCDFRKKELRDPVNVVGSLISQICSQSSWFPSDLQHAFEYSIGSVQRKRPSFSVLKQSLENFCKQEKVFLLVDALDECDNKAEVLDFFADLQDSLEHGSLLITSRNEQEIGDILHSFERVQLEDFSEQIDGDIQMYAHARLGSEARLCQLQPTVKADISSSIHGRSAGMFRWAQCQLDAISKLRTVRSIRIALDELPSGLDETYRDILRRVPSEDIEMVRKLLCWLAFAFLPLGIEELCEAIAIEPGTTHLDDEHRLSNPQDILSLCSSLVNVSDQGHVRLAHLSVKDYLLSPAIQADTSVSIFALSKNQANVEMAITCLTYLLYNSLSPGPSLTAPSYLSRLAAHPFLSHASTTWPYHFRACTPSPALTTLATAFLSPAHRSNFMSWVQVLNADAPFKWSIYPRHATPLYYASSFGLTSLVTALITPETSNTTSNTNPNAPKTDLNAPGSRFGGTPLHAAVLRRHVATMRVLLAAGADPNRADFNGVAPLHTAAAAAGEGEVVGLLVEGGADVGVVDRGGETPGDWARKAGWENGQKLLRAEGAERAEGGRGAEWVEERVERTQGVGRAEEEKGTERVWKRVVPYFPGWYDKRSGLESSIVVKVEIGAERFVVA